MDIHFRETGPLPEHVAQMLANLREALARSGRKVTRAGSGLDAPAGSTVVDVSATAPQNGSIWLCWDPSNQGSDCGSATTVLAFGESALANRTGIALPYPISAPPNVVPTPSTTVGNQPRVALAGNPNHPDVQAARQACELVSQAGIPLEIVGADTPMGTWDVLIWGPGAARDAMFHLPIEAMALGIPCVLTDGPEGHTFGDENAVGALFADFGNIVTVGEALVLVLRHPQLRPSLVERARRTATRHRASATAQVVIDTLTPLANQAASSMSNQSILAQLEQKSRELIERGHDIEARDHLEAARLIGATDPTVLGELARLRFLTGDPSGCVDLYAELAATHRSAAIHECHGMALIAVEDFEAAERAFRNALEIGAETADLHNNLGVVQYQLGQIQDAEASFGRALNLDAQHQDAEANLTAVRAL